MNGLRRKVPQALSPGELLEIVTPRTNTARIGPADNLFRSLGASAWVGTEIASGAGGCRFLVRLPGGTPRRTVPGQLIAAYPQAELRTVKAEDDPAQVGPDEQVVACTLQLAHPVYLPVRMFQDRDLDAPSASQADPILGIVAALNGLPQGWRGISQMVVRSAPDGWSAGYAALALEPRETMSTATTRADTSLLPVFMLLAALGCGATGWQAYRWYLAHDFLHIILLVVVVLLLALGLMVWIRLRGRAPVIDRELVRQKLRGCGLLAQIRLAVIAPQAVPAADLAAALAGLVAGYDRYAQGMGNHFVPRRLVPPRHGLQLLRPLPAGTGMWPFSRMVAALPILTGSELAGLWHLPQAGADVPLLERTGARRYVPAPPVVASGCRIGRAVGPGGGTVVHVPYEVVRHHGLLIARTGRGKSTLMACIARYLMETVLSHELRPALVLVDPHGDLAAAVLSLVPAGREGDVIYLDAANAARPPGLNLLDTGLGWSRDEAVANAIEVLEHEFSSFWGPRMETGLRYALQTLFEDNAAICASDPTGGRSRQYTLLDVPALLVNAGFRASVLPQVRDGRILAWWRDYFDRLDPRFRTEVIDPVQSKIKRLDASFASRHILGQPCSTVNLAAGLRPGSIIIIHTAAGTLGHDTAALLGGTFLNLIVAAIAAQAQLPPAQRVPVQLLVDEFHTMPAVNYERILSELAKFGAGLTLATQSLATLELLGKLQGRDLRAAVFANIDALFAFNTSAEDAKYLVPELGDGIAVADLVQLPTHHCYVRFASGGIQHPTFEVAIDPPAVGDAARRRQLVVDAAARYGRDRQAVERDLASALARIDLASQTYLNARQTTKMVVDAANPQATPKAARSKHGTRRTTRGGKGANGRHAPSMQNTAPDDSTGETASGEQP